LKSSMHKKATGIDTSRNLKNMISASAERMKEVTFSFFRMSYALISMYVPYKQFIRLYAALKLCKFNIGNSFHNEYAAAKVFDCFFDYFWGRLSRYVCSVNPCTGRPRQIFTSADKGTSLNQRQVINLTSPLKFSQ